MPTILHLMTRPQDDLSRALVRLQAAEPENSVEVVDLTAGEPDYVRIVEQIFAADSVTTW